MVEDQEWEMASVSNLQEVFFRYNHMKITFDYDEQADVLYLTFDKVEEAFCYEKKIPVLVRYNPVTDRVSGITILNLKEIKSWSYCK